MLMLFIPCVATATVMKREMESWKWFLSSQLLMLVISYSGGIIAYRLALWMGL
jgi:ferrous iron transport protein B